MDYLERAKLKRHADWDTFEIWRQSQNRRLILLTTKTDESYTEFSFLPGDCLLFGRESAGAPEYVHDVADQELTILMKSKGRSLNLAVSVAMVVGEVVRQLN